MAVPKAASATTREPHPPYRDTFLAPVLVTTVARLSAGVAPPAADADAARADLDRIFGDGTGAILQDAPGWLDGLRGLPDGCACCEPAYDAVYDQFTRAADVAARLVSRDLLDRTFGSTPMSAAQWAEAVKKWLARTDAPLPFVALVASAATDLAVPPDRRRSPAAEKLQQAFDRFAKGRGITTWPSAVAAADEAWAPGAVLWPMLLAAESAINGLDAALREADAKADAASTAAAAAERAARDAATDRAVAADAAALRAAEGRIRDLEEQLAAARRDATEARARASRVQTALDRLTAPPEDDGADDERQAPVAPPAAPEPVPEPEDPFPLRGEHVMLFTNQEREGVRAEQAAALEALGASVTVYFNKSLRTRAPDTFPPDALIVSDVAFAPHAKTDEIKRRAKKAGSRYVEGKMGAGSIGRIVADFVKQHRRRLAERDAAKAGVS